MGSPLVSDAINVTLSAEGLRFKLTLGPLVNDVTELSSYRKSIGIRFDEILLDFWTHRLKQITPVTNDGKIAQNGVLALQAIIEPN